MATIKQKKAAKALVGNGGNITQAMLEANYSPNTANTPQKLTKSKGWQEIMNDYLPDSLLAERHQELLNKRELQEATEWDVETGKSKKVYIDSPDTQAVSKGLDMAYKIKGSYAPEKHAVVTVDLSPAMKAYADQLLDVQRNTNA